LDRRREQNRTMPHLFIFVDELEGLTRSKAFTEAVGRIARVGREYGLHFIGAVQHPTVSNVGNPNIARNLPIRLVGRVTDNTAARVATGQSGTGAERLGKLGHFLLLQPGHSIRSVSVALLTDDDVAALPRGAGRRLDLGLDLDRVLDVAKDPPASRADELDPGHVAVALTRERGINWLCQELKIGSKKARRVRDFADAVREAAAAMGYVMTKKEVGSGA
jgi:DNA segregation ATPase FtsK/SpoIIIE-like protein